MCSYYDCLLAKLFNKPKAKYGIYIMFLQQNIFDKYF